ncbi:MAG: sugar ABC transporter permease, partial [Oscillospiraceae bacterium]
MIKSFRKIYPLYFIAPALLIYLVFFIFPSGTGLFYAFTDWNSRSLDSFNFIGFDNFKEIFTNSDLTLGLWNTVYFSFVTVIFKNLVGLGLALIANNNTPLSKYYARGAFYLPNFLNMVIIGVMATAILYPTGPFNTLLENLGLGTLTKDWFNDRTVAMSSVCAVEVWRTAGFHMVIYMAALKSIPSDYYEAAKIDGANSVQRFKHIILPLITQGITINLIFSIINGLKVFDQVYILTNGGPGNATQVVSTMIYKMFGRGQWGLGTAYNLVLTVVIMLICSL